MLKINWLRIDQLTPKYRKLIEKELSVQELNVLASICKEVADGDISAELAGIASRVQQTNHVHAVLGRLAEKGFLAKTGPSMYKIADQDLVAHLLVRTMGLNPRSAPLFEKRFSLQIE